jgi:hypothetical protein
VGFLRERFLAFFDGELSKLRTTGYKMSKEFNKPDESAG